MKNTAALSFLALFLQFLLAGMPQMAGAAQQDRPIDLNSPAYQKLFAELEKKHLFSRPELQKLFTDTTINPKVLRLMDKQWGKPLPWYKYKRRFVTAATINRGKNYLQKYRPLFDNIEQKFGVNREAIVAIWAIETRFGSNCGNFNMFRSLNTLFAAYPRRSSFFRQELIDYLLLCRDNELDPKTVVGSYAGAFGQAQFMPSSYRKYAIDYDGDGRADLLRSKADIFASIANYLREFGWEFGTPTLIDIGPELKSAALIATSLRGRKGKIDRQIVAKDQQISLPPSPGNKPLTVFCLEKTARGDKRCIAGYPNYQAILHYNHSLKYATVVSTLATAFAK